MSKYRWTEVAWFGPTPTAERTAEVRAVLAALRKVGKVVRAVITNGNLISFQARVSN